jgi:hypothetical protein
MKSKIQKERFMDQKELPRDATKMQIDNTAFEEALAGELGQAIRENNPAIERRSGISKQEFLNEYVQPGKPVILEGVLEKWPASKRWTFDYFQEQYGEIPVYINVYDRSNLEMLPLKEVICRLKAYEQGEVNRAPYLQEWNFQAEAPSLLEDITELDYFADDYHKKLFGHHVLDLWIGGKGGVTPMHFDFGFRSTFHAQFKGKKSWLFAPAGMMPPVTPTMEIDVKKVWEEEYLSQFSHAVLQPGDFLFFPSRYLHRVEVLENCISMSMSYIEERYIREFMKDCIGTKIVRFALDSEKIKKEDPIQFELEKRVVNNFLILLERS